MKPKYNVGDFVMLVPLENAICGDSISNANIWGIAYGKILRINRVIGKRYWGNSDTVRDANEYPTYQIYINEQFHDTEFSELELIPVCNEDLLQYDVDSI